MLGAPFDFGTQWRSGTRFGPRSIREASALFSFGHAGAYDHEDDITYLPTGEVRIVDIDDADIVGIDLVEVAPDYDQSGMTSILAAQLLMNLIGRILHHR